MNYDKKLNSNLTNNIYDNCYLIKIILYDFNLASHFEIVITPIDKISIVYFKLKHLGTYKWNDFNIIMQFFGIYVLIDKNVS